MKKILCLLFFVSFVVCARAQSTSWSLDLDYATGVGSFTWSVSGSAVGSGSGTGAEIGLFQVSGDGVDSTGTAVYHPSNSPTANQWGYATSGTHPLALTPNSWYMVKEWHTPTNSGPGGGWFVYNRSWFEVVEPDDPYRIRTTGTNNSDQPIRVGFINGAGVSILDIEVAPGSSWDETLVVDEGDGPFTPVIATRNEFSDGVWLSVDIEDATPTPSGPPISPSNHDPVPGTSTVVQNVTNNTVNNTTINNNISSNNSGNGQPSPWLPSTPSTTDTERLDKTTYKQGVDKLETAIKNLDTTKGLNLEKAPALDEPEDETELDAGQVSGLLSKLPGAPEIVAPTEVSSFSFTFEVPGVASAFPMNVDLEPYETQIGVFKAVIRAGLAIAFFLLVIKTLRDAFA